MKNSLLRTALSVDALTCLATGLVMTAGAGFLSGPLGLSAELLRTSGLSLLPFTAYLAYLARREEVSPARVWVAIAINVLWVVDSALLFAWTSPSALGHAVVIAQAVAVLGISALELVGLRRETESAVSLFA